MAKHIGVIFKSYETGSRTSGVKSSKPDDYFKYTGKEIAVWGVNGQAGLLEAAYKMPLLDLARCAYLNMTAQERLIYACQSPYISDKKEIARMSKLYTPVINFETRSLIDYSIQEKEKKVESQLINYRKLIKGK